MPTLDRTNTCLFTSMRTIEGDSTQGQFFEWAIGATTVISDTEYANLVTFYLSKEQQADSENLYGTPITGAAYLIPKFEDAYPLRPARPNPLTGRP